MPISDPSPSPTLPKSEADRPPELLTAAGALLSQYDVVLCDVWGVVHDGVTAYPGASDALSRFRAGGGTVVLVSNAPVPNDEVARMLAGKRVPGEAWDAIVSSGDIALAHIAEVGYAAVHGIGPRDRDAAFFARLTAAEVPLADADAIVATGLDDDRSETVESYRPLLERARERNLPFVCANPDLVVDVGGTLLLCAGALGEAYAALGGAVYWAGKPYPIAYDTALASAERIRGASVPRRRVLAIGDAVRTDLKAAETAGVDALFVASGIHREQAMRGEEIDAGGLARLLAGGAPPARAAMAYLAW